MFVLCLRDGSIELVGPCGPAPWYIEVGAADDPMEVVSRLAAAQLGAPLVAHSTSWRRDRDTVLLSFIVVLDDAVAPRPGVPVARAELARGSASAAPAAIEARQVIEHGLRHLAWLARDDQGVQRALPEAWHRHLAGYVPEPFRNL